MVRAFHNIREQYEEIAMENPRSELPMVPNELWRAIENYNKIMDPLLEATTKLQKELLLCSELFFVWEECIFKLKTESVGTEQTIQIM
jgi:hypothetical protein